MEKCAKDHLLSVAIDFGTTFSGYAFSTLHEYKTNPQSVSAVNWTANTGCLVSAKTSTCILFEPSGKMHSIGYEAEDKYSDLAIEEMHREWFFFRRFKMMLYNRKFDRRLKIKEINGKEMTALDILSAFIRGLKNHFYDTKRTRFEIEDSEICWVLTVPAIWNDAAKQLMREAAEQAGIPGDRMILALEPEAASVFCKHLPILKEGPTIKKENPESKSKLCVFQPGTKYMVLDAGGGTIDITVHKVRKDGGLKEIHCANGGDWGGTNVDEAFYSLLKDVIGEEEFDNWKEENMYDMMEIFRSFEVKKRKITSNMEGKLIFSLPVSLQELVKNSAMLNSGSTHTTEREKTINENVAFKGGKIFINAPMAQGFFNESLVNITRHVEHLLENEKLKDVSAILMVGGYSACQMLQDKIEKSFPAQKVIVADGAELSVLKGAVLTGHDPYVISTRISKFTYGTNTSLKFEKGIHDMVHSFTDEAGELFCDDIFDAHVRKGDSIKIDEPCPTQTYCVVLVNQEYMEIEIIASTDVKPKYVTDASCQKLGTLLIHMPDTTGGRDRKIDVVMNFSGSEVEVTATNRLTKEKYKANVNFLG